MPIGSVVRRRRMPLGKIVGTAFFCFSALSFSFFLFVDFKLFGSQKAAVGAAIDTHFVCSIPKRIVQHGPVRPLKVIILSTYLPRMCGLATFSHDLRKALLHNVATVDVVAMVRTISEHVAPEVKYVIVEDNVDDYYNAADWIDANGYDYVLIQHEFGIFGGVDGRHVMKFINRLQTPYILTTHTVTRKPNVHTRQIMSHIADKAHQIVNINPDSCSHFDQLYGCGDKCVVIPHGIPDVTYLPNNNAIKTSEGLFGRSIILCFGLMGPGKGLEHVIDAMAFVQRYHPNALLIILGRQHPDRTEDYIGALKYRVSNSGLNHNVEFRTKFVSDDELHVYLSMTDVFVTYYSDMNQASSGTLSMALGAGVACVSTPYLYAKSLLSDDRGILVEYGDPEKLSTALIDVLHNHHERERMRCAGYQYTRKFVWNSVADQYESLMPLMNHTMPIPTPFDRGMLVNYVRTLDTSAIKVLTCDMLDMETFSVGSMFMRQMLVDGCHVVGSGVVTGRMSLAKPVARGDHKSQGISNGLYSININAESQYIEMLRHNGGAIIGGHVILFNYENHMYEQGVYQHAKSIKTKRISATCAAIVIETDLMVNSGIEIAGHMTIYVSLCLSPHVTIKYTVDAVTQIHHVTLSTGIGQLSRGSNFDTVSVYRDDVAIHTAVWSSNDDNEVLVGQVEKGDWHAFYGHGALLVRPSHHISTITRHGYMISTQYKLGTVSSSTTLSERIMLMSRVWPSRMHVYTSFFDVNDMRDPSEPDNIGLIARAAAVVQNDCFNMGAIDTLALLAKSQPDDTSVSELYDALEAAKKLGAKRDIREKLTSILVKCRSNHSNDMYEDLSMLTFGDSIEAQSMLIKSLKAYSEANNVDTSAAVAAAMHYVKKGFRPRGRGKMCVSATPRHRNCDIMALLRVLEIL